MRCNGGTSAALSANVAAGQTVTAVWAQWTHQQGPVMVWLYKCAGAFTACDGSGTGWFKIDQMGMTAPPLSGTSWGTALVYKNLKWTSTIPESLAPGNYLIRHELLALHQANTPQFYPECAQIVVTGSGTKSPAASYLTPIPAYATQKDPGVTVSDVLVILASRDADLGRLIHMLRRRLRIILVLDLLFGRGSDQMGLNCGRLQPQRDVIMYNGQKNWMVVLGRSVFA